MLFLFAGAIALAEQVNSVTVTDLPTHSTIATNSTPQAFGLLPEISLSEVGDERSAAKTCFGSLAEDRRIVAAVMTQALSGAGFSVVANAPLKFSTTIQTLDCTADSKSRRHAAWRLSGTMTSGSANTRIRTVTIDGGRQVESNFPPKTAANFRDIDTPQGVAAASMRDRLRDLFQSSQFQFD
jgi:hypothetical protein